MPIIPPELIPRTVVAEVIQAVQEASVVLRLGRRQPMPTGMVSIPVLKTLPVGGWTTGVGGRKKFTSIEWSAANIVAEEVAAVIAVPEAYIDDTGFPVWANVRQAMVDALAYMIDSAILFGTAAPASFPTGGIAGRAIAAGNTAIAVPGTPVIDWATAVNNAMALVEGAGLMVTGHAADIPVASKFRGLRDTTGQPLFVPNLSADAYSTLYGYPILFSASGAFDNTVADLITGDWNLLVVGVRQDLSVETSTDGVITDAAGVVLANAFQDDQILIRVHMRVGYVIGQPTTRAKGAAAFPFALVNDAAVV